MPRFALAGLEEQLAGIDAPAPPAARDAVDLPVVETGNICALRSSSAVTLARMRRATAQAIVARR